VQPQAFGEDVGNHSRFGAATAEDIWLCLLVSAEGVIQQIVNGTGQAYTHFICEMRGEKQNRLQTIPLELPRSYRSWPTIMDPDLIWVV